MKEEGEGKIGKIETSDFSRFQTLSNGGLNEWLTDGLWMCVYALQGIGRRKEREMEREISINLKVRAFCSDPRSFPVHLSRVLCVCVSQDRTTWVTSRWFRPKVLLLPPSFFSLFEEDREKRNESRHFISYGITGSVKLSSYQQSSLPQLHRDSLPLPVPFPRTSDNRCQTGDRNLEPNL